MQNLCMLGLYSFLCAIIAVLNIAVAVLGWPDYWFLVVFYLMNACLIYFFGGEVLNEREAQLETNVDTNPHIVYDVNGVVDSAENVHGQTDANHEPYSWGFKVQDNSHTIAHDQISENALDQSLCVTRV